MEQTRVRLRSGERNELVERARSRTARAEDARRARLILMLSADRSYSDICRALVCNASYISRWKGRFLAERLAGLYSRHAGRAVDKRTPRLEAKILEWTRRSQRWLDPLEQPQIGRRTGG